MSHGPVVGSIPKRNCSSFGEKARPQEPPELATLGKDRGQYGSGQSAAGKEPHGAGGGTVVADHRPKGSDHQGQEGSERLPSPRKQPHRLQGDASRPAHVRVSRPAY